jgi:hypothetical protein
MPWFAILGQVTTGGFMPFNIIKNRFIRKLETDPGARYQFGFMLLLLVAVSVFLCLRHAVVFGLLVTPGFIGLYALQLLIDEHTERKQERELAESRKRWEANAPQRAYARAIFAAIRECPPDADDAYRQKAIRQAAEKFRSTCDTSLPEFLGVQIGGHFVPASER